MTPLSGIHYYEQVAKAMGGTENTQQFFRLFMVPGMAHCAGGPGANAFGQGHLIPLLPPMPSPKNERSHHIARALEAWVEDGVTPKKIIATKYVNNKPEEGIEFTRPLCAYPQIGVYQGSGSKDLAENFTCVDNE